MTTAIVPRATKQSVRKEKPGVDFEIVGAKGAPVIVVLGGISASRHVTSSERNSNSGWWENSVGAGKWIDTDNYRVLSIDYLTESFSDGPVTTSDQARAVIRALDQVGVARSHAVVGASYGGMVALALGAGFPERCGKLVIVGAAHESHPRATALRILQRRIVELGQGIHSEREGFILARSLAITSYGTADEFGAQFPSNFADAGGICTAIEDHLRTSAVRFADTCSVKRYLALSLSLDLHRIAPEDVSVPTTIVAVRDDALIPIEQVRELAGRLAGPCKLIELTSAAGHDAFLNAPEIIGPIISNALTDATAQVVTARESLRAGKYGSTTCAVRAGIATDLHHRAVVPPIHLTSTFAFNGFGQKGKYDYTRSGNPTRDQLGNALAELEGGVSGVVTSTGMSAVALVLQLVQPGDLILAAHDCYGGTHRILRSLAARGHFTVAFVDLTALDAEDIVRRRKPKLLWIETPSNPLLRITDLDKVTRAGREAGAIVAVDNTFLSPALQRPLEFGAHLVVHSTTKYLNGHSDVVGGAVIAADTALAEELTWWANCLGITGAPFDSYLTLRGIRTLGARMRVHIENVSQVVDLLAAHPAVEQVYYPGLKTHPGHEVAARQQDGFGAMVSFELGSGTGAVEKFCSNLKCFTLAESLGGVESLIAHPATMTHASMDDEARAAAGIKSNLLRLSVGIEDAADLVEDLRQALEAV